MFSKVLNRFLVIIILVIFVIVLVGIIFNKSLENLKLIFIEV